MLSATRQQATGTSFILPYAVQLMLQAVHTVAYSVCMNTGGRYNMSGNVMYNAGMEFNGGTQVFTHGNLFVHGGWTVCAAPPDYGGGRYRR